MTVNEAIKEIKARQKPYAQIKMPQSTFVNTIRNIEAGLAKHSTVIDFMGKFGYELVNKDVEWKRK